LLEKASSADYSNPTQQPLSSAQQSFGTIAHNISKHKHQMQTRQCSLE